MARTTMRCDACGFELTPTAKFCSECGEPVARASVPQSARTGAPESAPLPQDGERRQLTVLFSDLVGSTAIASRLDPEDWREVVNAYQSACAQVIERFGGYVAQYLGDGLVVYFGFPHASEDDVFRATRAGLGIVEALADLSPRLSHLGVKLSARVGVHTGTVVVGEVGGSSRRETLALGDTTNLAARLQEVAAPDTVVISEGTFRLVRGAFVTEDRGVHTLKGIQKPVTAYRVVRPLRVRSSLVEGEGEHLSPLVGRGSELAALEDAWERASAGSGEALLVSGDAGLGKSRLLWTLRERLGGRAHTWLEARAATHTEDSPLYPIVTLQEEALGLGAYEKREQRTAVLERSLTQAGLPPAEHLALFAALHDLPLPPRFAPLDVTPEAQRRRTLDSLMEWLVRLADEQPALILIEDLQWIDPTTLELVDRLVERCVGHRMLLVLTHRSTFEPPWGEDRVRRLALTRLSPEDARALVASVGAPDRELPAEIVREIVERSDGVPLFLEEVTKAVLESAASGPDGTLTALVPPTLQASLMARLDQLGPVKDTAQLCATLGREFPLDVLEAASPLPPLELQGALGRLVQAGLLVRRALPSGQAYSFRHALIQEQAYEALLKTTRQAYHAQIATIIRDRFPERATQQPEVLAHHYDSAGDSAQALGHWLAAGQKSIGRSAHLEASRQLQRGLHALGKQPESAERDQQELLLLTMRGVALIAARGYGAAEVEEAFARARVLCQRLGDTPHLFPVLFGLCLFYLVRARPREAHDLAAQIEAISRATGDVECLLETHGALGALCFWEGRFGEAQEHLLRARTLFDPMRHGHHAFVYGQDPLAYGYIYGALSLWFLGYPEQAQLSADKAVELAELTNHPLTLAGVLSFAADLHHHLKNPEMFDQLAERTITVATEQNLPMWAGSARSLRGWAAFQRGEHDAGVTEIRAGLEAFERTGAETNASYLLARIAEACLEMGRAGEGLAAVELAIGRLETTLDRYYAAELHRLRGELLRIAGPGTDEARAAFERALTIARTQSARSLELRAAMSLGRLLFDSGDAAGACELLAPVYEWFTEGHDTQDLRSARSLLSSWGKPPS